MLISNLKPECIWKCNLILGESTLWISRFDSIFFVDIKKKKILSLHTKKNKKNIFKVDKEIGFISFIEKNIFVFGLKSEIRIVDLKKRETIISIPIELNKPNNRINDGKVDPSGRLWFGTMDNFEKKQTGSLYCLDSYFNLHKVDS